MDALRALLEEISSCRICAEHLDLGPRPVLCAEVSARVLIIGQAPGTRVHESGIPWNDNSGERLRQWMDVTTEVFYDASRIAIMPMGFCYPGRNPKGGDMPPRPECAPKWHSRVLDLLPNVELTLLVGGYAQAHYLHDRSSKTMTETVLAWHDCAPTIIPTPHPSWRTTNWLKKNPWFKTEVLPELRRHLADLL